MTAEAVPAEPTSRRTSDWAALGLALLMVLGVFYVFGAVSNLTFALLFLVLLAIPFRRRQRWAWWAAWILSNIAATVDLPSSARPVR